MKYAPKKGEKLYCLAINKTFLSFGSTEIPPETIDSMKKTLELKASEYGVSVGEYEFYIINKDNFRKFKKYCELSEILEIKKRNDNFQLAIAIGKVC